LISFEHQKGIIMSSKLARRKMGRTAIRTGGTLTILGVGGYLASRGASPTALIPAALGAPIMGWGVASHVPLVRRMARPALGSLAIVTMAGTARGLKQLPALFRGEAERPMAVVSQCATFAVGGVLLGSVLSNS
jgi:hypothetical protein